MTQCRVVLELSPNQVALPSGHGGHLLFICFNPKAENAVGLKFQHIYILQCNFI